MNLMNINERVFRTGESLCFVDDGWAVFGLEQPFWARFYITNATATTKKWFIKVHLVHRLIVIRNTRGKLMNLMNFNELTCYLRLSFVMYQKRKRVAGSSFQVPSSHKFIWFIKNGGLA